MSNNNEKEIKKSLFEKLKDGTGNVMNTIGKVGGSVARGVGSAAEKAVNIGSDIADKQRIKSKNKEIDNKILDHKYNIGRYIYDNELEIDDGVIISTINTIDRIVDEITKMEGKNNG